LHATGFEPVTSYRKTDYESAAFDLSAMHASITTGKFFLLVDPVPKVFKEIFLELRAHKRHIFGLRCTELKSSVHRRNPLAKSLGQRE
jgi:hypothetical protein